MDDDSENFECHIFGNSSICQKPKIKPKNKYHTKKKREKKKKKLKLKEKKKKNYETKLVFTLEKNELDNIKEKIKSIDWYEISDNWKIKYQKNGLSLIQSIELNPYEDCSTENPLYMHKEWLGRIYNDPKLNLSDRIIGKICDVSHKTIGKWRKKFNIPTRGESGRYIDSLRGYIRLFMPKDYFHPELNPMGDKRIHRYEHIVCMEEYLMKILSPKDLSNHPCLIKSDDGRYYIKRGCVVHHKDYIADNNGIENLHLYKGISEHNNNNINKCLSGLIKLGQIRFNKGNYYLNEDYSYRNLTSKQIDRMIRPVEFFRFEDIDLVKKAIKNIDWSDMEWTIEHQFTWNSPIRSIQLNPYEDFSKENPLYLHGGWMERIVHDKRFNLIDSRLGDLCGISERTAFRWRKEIHKIRANLWGYDKYLHSFIDGRKAIWIKILKSYGNPFASKKERFDYMLEHRYIMEKYLAQKPELNKKSLIGGKYLKSECVVHHINFDSLDNRLENLWMCKNDSEHATLHSSLLRLIKELLRLKYIIFENGTYFLNY